MKKKTAALLAAVIIACSLPYAVSAATISPAIEVIASATESVKAGLYNCDVIFTENDFLQNHGVSNIESVTFTSVPPAEDGYLFIHDTVIKDGTSVHGDMLGYLRFRAASTEISSTDFTYTLSEELGGTQYTCNIVFLDEINVVPATATPEIYTLETFKNVPLFSCLTASDPEGDELTFRITKQPKNGTVELLSEKYGDFCYRPNSRHTGKDSFCYVVCDKYGNFSAEQKITVKTVKNRSKTVFSDMDDSKASYASVLVTDMGLMNGVKIGEKTYFEPNGKVTRAEMLAMLMEAANIEVTNGSTEVFSDNTDIPEKYQSYVATAIKLGFIKGSNENGKTVFRPNDSVTRGEAAMMASAILGNANTAIQTFADADSCPAWCENAMRTAVANALILPINGTLEPNAAMTRAECAIMLNAMANKY